MRETWGTGPPGSPSGIGSGAAVASTEPSRRTSACETRSIAPDSSRFGL